MRIGGLASGIDTDEMVEKLMAAERMPLERMEQDRTELEWKSDGFRDINKTLLELDNMIFDMKMSGTYHSKNVSSSMEDAVTATARSDAEERAYHIKVKQLATSAMNMSTEKVDIDKTLSDLDGEGDYTFSDKISFKTYDEDGNVESPSHTIDVSKDDTVKDVLQKINDDDNNVRAFYDEQSGRVIMETTRTGQYNENGPEIDFGDDSFFTNVLHMTGEETGGQDAKFTYNGRDGFESKDNNYTLNGVTFSFHSETDKPATLNVSNDTDSAVDAIMDFVDKYNEVVDVMNGSQQEEKHRDYKPLTEEQKEEMSEKEIELWEEKAKSGILRGESTISNGLYSMRNSWYSKVETGGEIKSLTQIGIETSSSYMDGGKLIVDEGELRESLQKNPDEVKNLFSNSNDDASRGLVNRLEDSVDQTMKTIKARAGSDSSASLDNFTLGKRMKDINDRISDFEDRLVRIETRYWNQFSAMEKAIQEMNQQSSYMMSQFGEM